MNIFILTTSSSPGVRPRGHSSYIFFLLVCKLEGGGHPWLSHYTCKQWLYACNLWTSRVAQQFYFTQTCITHCHTKSSCCKENAAGPDWWQHCHSSLCPRDSVSFHSDSEACKLTQTHTHIHRVVVQRVQMCSRGTHESVAIKWSLVRVGAKGFIASAIVL